MKEFNTTGTCIPEKHYMVDISEKLEQTTEMIDHGKYFTINRPRQYGKTTVLYLLERKLRGKYIILRMSFEGLGDELFQKESSFVKAFLSLIEHEFRLSGHKKLIEYIIEHESIVTLDQLSTMITDLCSMSAQKLVLMIDEVDQSGNHQLFFDFLGMLRRKFLQQNEGKDCSFHSVILAGVHDVKSLKMKIRSDENQKLNSPWNIAVEFDVDLSFSPAEIITMLQDYQSENNVQMDVDEIATKLHYYTSGYPFLVSRLCQIISGRILPEKKVKLWEIADIGAAVKQILQEKNTNFDSLIKNLENNPDLYTLVSEIILEGAEKVFNRDNHLIHLGEMYGIFRPENEKIKIHNRIYEQRIYNYMTSKVETSVNMSNYNFRNQFIDTGGKLDFEKILTKFQEFMKEEYSERDGEFLEHNGRLLFLAFLKPIINGYGFDFKEVQISEEKRLDVVVTYQNTRYVTELKIWRGEQAHQRGLNQLRDYLERLGLDQGYLVIYDLRKNTRKEWKQDRVIVDGKEIVMVWV